MRFLPERVSSPNYYAGGLGTMKVQVVLYATLSHLLPQGTTGSACIMDVDDKTKIKDLLQRLNVPSNSVKVIFLNGRQAQAEQEVQEGDRVAVFPPVAGG